MKKFLFLFLLFLSLCYGETDEVFSKINFIINGHEHPLPDNAVKGICDYYKQIKDEAALEQKGKKVGDYWIRWMKLGDKIKKFSYSKIDNETINVQVKIDSNSAKLTYYVVGNPNTIIRWSVVTTITFDLILDIDIKLVVNKGEILFIIEDANYKLKRVHLDKDFADDMAHILNGFKSISFSNSLTDYIGDTTSVFSFYDKQATTVINGASIETEMEALNKSLSIEVEPIYIKKPEPKLLFDVKFMHQYIEDDGYTINNSIENYEPNIPVLNSLSYAGISYMHWNSYNYIDKTNPLLNDINDRFSVLINKMENLGLNQLRTEAIWSKIVPTVNSVSSTLDPSQIPDIIYTGDIIDEYIDEIDSLGGWQTLDYLINKVDSSSIVTDHYIVVGCGHSSRPPKFLDNGKYKIIAPGTVRGDNDNDYLGVAENVYLYWLKKYTRAVVRRYKDKINIWQIENELNAARFTESFGWWRKGDAWSQDYEDGFQDKVIELLYNAVKLEDPNSQTLTSFHILNATKRIKEWNEYCDIIGLHIYPHLFHAYPTLGFLAGEYVWATKRILASQSTPNKPIWITETGYPAKTNEDPPEDFIQSIFHFNQTRQQQYLEDAISSSTMYGATGFNWFRMYSEEEDSTSNDIESINGYSGFYDNNDNLKIALPVYSNTFYSNNNTGNITFFTKSLEDENLKGNFRIENTINSLPSGKPINLVSDRDYNINVINQFLYKADSAIVQQHHWNDEDNYNLRKTFNSTTDLPVQEARYKETYQASFSVNIDAEIDSMALIKRIKICDPWYKTTNEKQPNEFVELGFSVDTTIYDVFLNQNIIQGDPYYIVKAPNIACATLNNIYVFDQWSGSGVSIISPNNRETQLVFQNEGEISLEANYSPILNITNYTLNIPEDEELVIPEGAEYNLLEGFTMNVEGNLFINGTESQPIIFSGQGRAASYDPISCIAEDPEMPEDIFIHIKGNSKDINISNTNINNIYCGIYIENESNIISIHNCKIYNTNTAILLGEFSNSQIHITDSEIYNNHAGIVYNQRAGNCTQESLIDIYRCRFYDNNYGVVFYPAYNTPVGNSSKLYLVLAKNTFYEHANFAFWEKPVNDVYTLGYLYGRTVGNIFSTNSIFASATIGSNKCFDVLDRDDDLENTNYDTLFIDAPNGDFHLKYNSPAINYLGSSSTCMTLLDFLPWYTDIVIPDYLNWELDEFDVLDKLDAGAYTYTQTVLTDTVLVDSVLDGTVQVPSDIMIAEGVELKFLPGTVVKLGPDADINVYGRLKAQGTSDNKIIFTTLVDTPTVDDYWSRIDFKDSADDNSIIEHCKIEYADNGVWMYRSSIDIRNSEIGPIKYTAIYPRYTVNNIINNYIHDCTRGIFLLYGNDYGNGTIWNNTIENCSSMGLYLYRSSPLVTDNQICDNGYGIYCTSYASPDFGTYYEYGNNQIDNNTYGLYVNQSAPFLGRDFCDINGGYNSFTNNTDYHIKTNYGSYVEAENNWWGAYPPNSSDFENGSGCVIDISPALQSSLFKTVRVLSDDSAFDSTFIGIDSTITEEEVMENYDADWPILQRLQYARNLILLGFPKNAAEISNNVLKTFPDSVEAFFALDVLWQSGRGYTPEFEMYKNYLDSLASTLTEAEIYEEAELLLEEYNTIDGLTKNLNTYKKYKSSAVAARSLLRDVVYFVALNDMENAQVSFSVLKSDYPKSQATEEARILLMSMEGLTDEVETAIPDDYVLYHNYPNPFNPITHIRFGVPEVSNIEITIFNILGQKVASLKQDALQPGFHEMSWNSRNNEGVALASGLYVYHFKALSSKGKTVKFEKTSKMLLLK